mgnify:CR=1 FL=1
MFSHPKYGQRHAQQVFLHRCPQTFCNHPKTNLLQNYVFIPLDIFKESVQNEGIRNRFDAWLLFLSTDSPEKIIDLIQKYPDFRVMYEHVYYFCQNVERVMEMYSEELRILDRNTVQYMVDEMQEEIEMQRKELAVKDKEILRLQTLLNEHEKQE